MLENQGGPRIKIWMILIFKELAENVFPDNAEEKH